MNKKSGTSKDAADKLVKNIRRKTRRLHSPEEKIRIVLAGKVIDTTSSKRMTKLGGWPHLARTKCS